MVPSRREFLTNAGLTGVAALVGRPSPVGYAYAQVRLDQDVRMIRSPVLDIGYEEHGDSAGFPIILLHGFPYDVRAWDGVVPPLADAGYRVLVPYLRGYGPTQFRDPTVPPMAEQAAIAQDVVDFADALGLEQFALAGFDWGNRAACIAAILRPERVRVQVACGGYSVQRTPSVRRRPHHRSSRRGSGISGTSTPSEVGRVLRRIEARSAGTCGRHGRPVGSSPTRCTTAQLCHSTIRPLSMS